MKIAAKSCSLDPVPASLLPYCINDLVPIIKIAVNLSFASASMPSSLKKAVLSPLLKKPSLDFEIFSNFRPVSNLKFLSGVIQKVAAMCLPNYLYDNDLNESLQSAYKEQHSCKTALLQVQNDILKSVDNKQCVILLLLDLSAAFDTADHEILWHRLRSKFGINERRMPGFSRILQIVLNQYKLMGLFLQFTGSDLVYLRVVQYTQTESDRLRQCTVRLTGSQVVRDLEIWHVGLLAIHPN